MDSASQNRLSKVHPELAARVTRTIEDLAAAGLDVRVVQGLRTYAEQNDLYAQGRTRPGQVVTKARGGYSNHNFGLAADLCPFTDGKPDWNDLQAFAAIGKAAKSHGLEWGGDWKKFKDMPHVELPGPELKLCRILYENGGLLAVWNRVNQTSSTAAPPRKSLPADSGASNSATRPPSIQSLLKAGSKGPEVRRLQDALATRGFLSKAQIDGHFGTVTGIALKNFQRGKGLDPDGIAGENTLKALNLA